MTDEGSFEEFEDKEVSSQDRFKTALEELQKRCTASNIEYKMGGDEAQSHGQIFIPCGQEKRQIFVSSTSDAESLCSINFEKYVFIRGYEAICSYSDGTIEAAVRPADATAPMNFLTRRLFLEPPSGAIELEPPRESGNQPKLRLGAPSSDFNAFYKSSFPKRLTLTLSDISVTNNDIALETLLRYANSLFFQIDLSLELALILERDRRIRPSWNTRRSTKNAVSLEYPRSEFDTSAISLYWYARSARGMPLLQFLAFYQVIEFYYPRYSHVEARKRLSSILKDPTFRGDRDDHLDRLISSILVSRNGSIGDERSQLRAVISHCITEEDIRTFLSSDTEREAHFSEKSKKQRYHKIPVQNKTLDLRNDVADRIYDIRCKIVHTKDNSRDGEIEMILPFTTEADYLLFDIDLVKFVAKSVLIVASAPL